MGGLMYPAIVLICVINSAIAVYSDDPLLVNMTFVSDAHTHGALCLDGSLPGYNLDRGFGEGARNWLLQFEGGGWCNDLASCFERSKTYRGSSRYMRKIEVFSGILSNNESMNPDFFNWNRVKIRYCDGGSFIGDSIFDNGTHVLYFKGLKIWQAIIRDLLPQGLGSARQALLSGCSAGGLASFLHCDGFANTLPNASVKCMSDAGLFLDEKDISMQYSQRLFFEELVNLQGAEANLNEECTSFFKNKSLCIFPQHLLRFISTPFFILNTAYDVYQFHHILVPPSADKRGRWNHCKLNVSACDASQIEVLQGFRNDMVTALYSYYKESRTVGMFINSCFAHCQSEMQETWLASESPRIRNKTIAEAVGNWYFHREMSKLLDGPYPSDDTCHNLIPSA